MEIPRKKEKQPLESNMQHNSHTLDLTPISRVIDSSVRYEGMHEGIELHLSNFHHSKITRHFSTRKGREYYTLTASNIISSWQL